MPSSRHLRAVRSASVAAALVVVAGATSLWASSEMVTLYLVIVGMGGAGWLVVRSGYPTLGALLASLAGLVYPWYGLWTFAETPGMGSEIGWFVLATCIAAVSLHPSTYVGFATVNAAVVYALVRGQPAIDPSHRWGLAGLLGLLFVSGTVVAWQRRRLADDVEQREADLRAAELDARQRAAAAEAARERLERAHTELMTRSRTAMVGELSQAIGHEINNPLTAIVMASEGLATQRPHDHEVREAVGLIREASARCRSVVGRLLSHAHLGESLVDEVEFAGIARDALALTRRHLQQVGATLECELDDTIAVTGNGAELRQIVFNLLVFVASRQPTRVVVRGGTSPAQAWLAIRDDGGPMPDDERASAFQPLLDGRPSPMIGLAMCRTLVRRNGGRIALASNPLGCTFTVALPCARGSARA